MLCEKETSKTLYCKQYDDFWRVACSGLARCALNIIIVSLRLSQGEFLPHSQIGQDKSRGGVECFKFTSKVYWYIMH